MNHRVHLMYKCILKLAKTKNTRLTVWSVHTCMHAHLEDHTPEQKDSRTRGSCMDFLREGERWQECCSGLRDRWGMSWAWAELSFSLSTVTLTTHACVYMYLLHWHTAVRLLGLALLGCTVPPLQTLEEEGWLCFLPSAWGKDGWSKNHSEAHAHAPPERESF